MLEITILDELQQELWEMGRTLYLFFLIWYLLLIIWFLVNPRKSWLYTVNYYYLSIYKNVGYISSTNVFAKKIIRFTTILFYAGIEPLYVLWRTPKAISKSHNTPVSRNTAMVYALERLPMEKVHQYIKLCFYKNGEWYDIDFDEVRIFVIEEPDIEGLRQFYNLLNKRLIKYSGKYLKLTFPKYQTGELNILFMKIIEVKKL